MSIADSLFDAVNEIDSYMRDDGPFGRGNLDVHVLNVRDAMEILRCRLDVSLSGEQPVFRTYVYNDSDAA